MQISYFFPRKTNLKFQSSINKDLQQAYSGYFYEFATYLAHIRIAHLQYFDYQCIKFSLPYTARCGRHTARHHNPL